MVLDQARSCSGDASETKCLRRFRTSMEDASAKPGKSDSQPYLARDLVTEELQPVKGLAVRPLQKSPRRPQCATFRHETRTSLPDELGCESLESAGHSHPFRPHTANNRNRLRRVHHF